MKQNEVLFLFVSLFIIVCAWIAFSVVHSSLTSTITESQAVDISPINAKFDTKTLDLLKKKVDVIPQFSMQPQSNTEVVATPAQVSPTPQSVVQIATPSGQTASGGAQRQ